jgi:hypothetical protein
MERTIGNLGEEIKQPSNPYANLSQRGVRRAQVNALKSLIPDLDHDIVKIPRGARDLGDGYILLRAKDRTARLVEGKAGEAIKRYISDVSGDIAMDWNPQVVRWARLRLPNGQVARSAWKEMLKPLNRI